MGDGAKWLKENTDATLLFHDGKVLSVEAPLFVELAIAQSDPGIQGDRASGATKPATLETGVTIQVPLFLNEGDIVKVTSAVGEVQSKARVTPAVVPGVVAISFHCGHWEYGRFASGNPTPYDASSDPDSSRIWWEGRHGVHPNWIIPTDADPISGQMRWMDTVVRVAKV